MKEYQQRVINEKNELDEKLNKLIKFFSNHIFETLNPNEKDLLKQQSIIMRDYSNVLQERISSFKNDEKV